MNAGALPPNGTPTDLERVVRLLLDDPDPYAFVGHSQFDTTIVRLQDYFHAPQSLGSFWAPGIQMQEWMYGCVNTKAVSAKNIKQYWEHNQLCLSRVSNLFPERGSFFVIEQDKLLVPDKETRRMLDDGISMEEVKALQGQLSFQAAQATGMPFTLAVHSGSKSVHYYIKPADPENWPLRPMQGCSNNLLLPDILQEIGKSRLSENRREEKDGLHEPWHRFVEKCRIALGDVDTAVLHASGRNGLVRIPGGIRDDGTPQQILGFGQPVKWADMHAWLEKQLSDEARTWANDPYRNATRESKSSTDIVSNVLRIRGEANWQGMVLRRVGPEDREREMNSQWASIVSELYPSQCMPEIVRRPNWEAGDWGEIRASYMWWFSALAVNALSLPKVVNHAAAPCPFGWFFTGNDWWWEDDKGNPHRIRDMWMPGNEGTFNERAQIRGDNLGAVWEASLPNYQQAINEWAEKGFDGRSAPSFGIEEKVKISNQPATEANQGQKFNLNERTELFASRFGQIVRRTNENTVPFQSCWMGFDGKVWRTIPVEIVHAAAVTALDKYPVFDAKGVPMQITPKLVTDFVHYTHSDETNGILYRELKWEQNEACTVFNNGTLYVNGGDIEFKPNHWDHKDLATTMLSYDYNPDVETPLFDHMMESMFPDENDRELLLQFMGYSYDPRNIYKKFALIKGGTDTGKTTLQTILTAIVGGDDHVLSPSISSMTSDRHWAANLPNTRLISIDEQTDTPMQFSKQAAALFKQLSGDGTIEVRKMRKEGFSTQVKAKMVVTTNNQPHFSDDSTAFWNRCLYFEPALPKKKIPYLADNIIKNELPGVAYKLATALARLKSANGFEVHPDMTLRIEAFREANSPLVEFWNEWMVETEDSKEYCYLPAIMKVFNADRKSSGGGFKSMNNFRDKLTTTFPGIKISRVLKRDLHTKKIHHLPPEKHIPNSVFIARGFKCTHQRSDDVISPPEQPLEIAGTLEDKTTMGNIIQGPFRQAPRITQ
ncbi:MAG: hypothetical protein F6K48_03375 [Okeania sp. SIO3H1]|nr:hypothetical protein [Okeania sp. SIO3H1]